MEQEMIYPFGPDDDFGAYPREHANTSTLHLCVPRCCYGLKLTDFYIGDTETVCMNSISDSALKAKHAATNHWDRGIYNDLWLCEEHVIAKDDLTALSALISLRRSGLMQHRAEGLYGIDMTGASDEELAGSFLAMLNEPRIPIDAPSAEEVQAHMTGVGMVPWLTEAMERMIRLGMLEEIDTGDGRLRARPTPFGRACVDMPQDELDRLRGRK